MSKMEEKEPPRLETENLTAQDFAAWKVELYDYLSSHQHFQLFLPGGLYPRWSLLPAVHRIKQLHSDDTAKSEAVDSSLTPKQELGVTDMYNTSNEGKDGEGNVKHNEDSDTQDNKTTTKSDEVKDKILNSASDILQLRNVQLSQMIDLICNLSNLNLPDDTSVKSYDGIMELLQNTYKLDEPCFNILELSDIQYKSNEDYNAFYVKLRSSVCNQLKKKGDKVQFMENKELLEDEILSPTFEEVIVLWSLEKIHPDLPRQVRDSFGNQLVGGVTLKDLQREIFEFIPAFKDGLSRTPVAVSAADTDMLDVVPKKEVTKKFKSENTDDEDFGVTLRESNKVKKNYYESEAESDTETSYNKVFKDELIDIKQEDFDDDDLNVGEGINESFLQQNMFIEADDYTDYFDDSTTSNKAYGDKSKKKRKKKKIENGTKEDETDDDDGDRDYIEGDGEVKVKVEKRQGGKPAKELFCTLCNHGFTLNKNLRRHMRKKHGKSFPEDNADKKGDPEEFQKYMDDTGTVCTFCGKAFLARSKLVRHISTHLKEKNFPCDVCGKSFSCHEYMRAHMKNHFDEERSECPECGKSMGKKSMRRHLMTHSEGSSFPCEVCGKAFKCLEYLNSHSKSHADEERADCPECGKSVAKVSLKRHLMTHTDAKSFPCEVCGKSFKCLDYLTSHQRSHAKEDRVQCLDCGKTVARLSMKRHMMTHNKENKFPCEICGRNFKCLEYLNSHLKCHKTGKDKNVVCSDCGVSLTKKSLRRHMLRTHTKKEKAFPCDICGKSYACLEYLNAHIARFHSEDKNVVCPDCGVTVNKSSFKRHALLHKADAVKCEICNKRMGSLESLERHMKKHSENPNFSTRKPYKRIRHHHKSQQPPPPPAHPSSSSSASAAIDLWRKSSSSPPPSSVAAAAASLWKQQQQAAARGSGSSGGDEPQPEEGAQFACEAGCGKKFKLLNMMRIHMEVEKCGQRRQHLQQQDKAEVDTKPEDLMFEMRPLAD